jgi:hypothetical protein
MMYPAFPYHGRLDKSGRLELRPKPDLLIVFGPIYDRAGRESSWMVRAKERAPGKAHGEEWAAATLGELLAELIDGDRCVDPDDQRDRYTLEVVTTMLNHFGDGPPPEG